MEKANNKQVIFAGHLEEFDDLKKWDRDAPLDMDREDNKEGLDKIVDAIVEKMKENGRKSILFISSSKIRSRETSELIAKGLKEKLGDDIKIRFSDVQNLDTTYQGEFILPEDYKAGEVFQGLKIAGKIYTSESLINKNLHYRFGDPMAQEDGTYKYPELLPYFSKSGETYAEPLIRIFTSVLEMSKKVNKLDKNTEVVIVAHGLTYHILRGLMMVGDKILNESLVVEKGELAFKIWEQYLNRTSELKNTAYGPLDISNLGNSELIRALEEETEYLKK